MGTCASSQYTSKDGKFRWPTTVNIIQMDGRLQQYKEPIEAGHVLSQNPNCFICCSESMYLGSLMPHVAPNYELQLEHIYFLVPLSMSPIPLSLQDLCELATKANASLAHSEAANSVLKSSCLSHANCLTQSSLSRISQGYSHKVSEI